MTRFKYIKRGVKRRHNIIEDILSSLEKIALIEGVKKVTPAKISYSPTRGIAQNKQSNQKIRFQRDTISGFKLLAHGKGSIQEIFVVIDGSKRETIRNRLITLLGDEKF